MKLDVYVHGKPVATLDSTDGFEHVMTYYPHLPASDFVSLLMPVQTKSYAYPELHPVFQMNLPEGFLLSMLTEQLGPHVGASPLNLLAVVGRNMIGRLQLAAPGADLSQPPLPFEVRQVLRGDNAEEAFVELVRRFATSGVSGVVPKFLSPQVKASFNKASISTPRYIIKGSSARLPYIALNEHLSMTVCARAGFRTATTEVSDDGQALLVHRFDVDELGRPAVGMEDLCSLLGLRPAQKYETTWERVTHRVKDFVPAARQAEELEQLAGTLLLTYALGNADCHSKNVALTYTGYEDVAVAPIYDMLSIIVYDDYALNPPGMSLAGRKTWTPRASLQRFTQTAMALPAARHRQLVERICEAIVETTPEVIAHAEDKPGFRELAKQILHAWNRGMQSLKADKSYTVPDLQASLAAAGMDHPAALKTPKRQRVGRSDLLGPRGTF
ncbi:MAG: type II toxin-antitoxin system HipA family toxin [Pseudomonadota bacterium]